MQRRNERDARIFKIALSFHCTNIGMYVPVGRIGRICRTGRFAIPETACHTLRVGKPWLFSGVRYPVWHPPATSFPDDTILDCRSSLYVIASTLAVVWLDGHRCAVALPDLAHGSTDSGQLAGHHLLTIEENADGESLAALREHSACSSLEIGGLWVMSSQCCRRRPSHCTPPPQTFCGTWTYVSGAPSKHSVSVESMRPIVGGSSVCTLPHIKQTQWRSSASQNGAAS